MERLVSRVDVYFAPYEDVEIHGFTPRFVKSLVIQCSRRVGVLLLERAVVRRGLISPVFRGFKPLISGDSQVLKSGVKYWFRVGVLGRGALRDTVFKVGSSILESLGSGSLEVSVYDLSSGVSEARIEPHSGPLKITFHFLSPVVLRARVTENVQEVVSPDFPRIMKWLYKAYIMLCYRRSVRTNYSLIGKLALSFSIVKAPELKMVRVDTGDPSRPPTVGYVGRLTCLYSPVDERVAGLVPRLLAIAHTIGVGSFRGLGFGVTNIYIEEWK